MNYADVVDPREMQTKQGWVEQTLSALAGANRKSAQADVRCLSQSWGDFCHGLSVRQGSPERVLER